MFDVERDRLGRFVSWHRVDVQWRAGVTLNGITKKGKYYGAAVFRWFNSKGKAKIALRGMQHGLIEFVERQLGYSINEWWFMPVYGFSVDQFLGNRGVDVMYIERV